GTVRAVLWDGTTCFQFRCQRPFHANGGGDGRQEFGYSLDPSPRRILTPVMDYAGGGSVGLVQMSTQATELPTYLKDDWFRDWGVLDRLRTFPDATGEQPRPVEVDVEEKTRSGFWYNGPMKYNDE